MQVVVPQIHIAWKCIGAGHCLTVPSHHVLITLSLTQPSLNKLNQTEGNREKLLGNPSASSTIPGVGIYIKKPSEIVQTTKNS